MPSLVEIDQLVLEKIFFLTPSMYYTFSWLSPLGKGRGILFQQNTQVPSSDVITPLYGYSSASEAWKVFVYVNGGARAMCGA